MATVLEEFVMTLGFDASGTKKGADEVDKNLKNVNDAFNKTSQNVSKGAKGAASELSNMRTEVIALFAAFTAGKGLKDFIQDTVSAETTLGRLSLLLGQSVQTLSTWSNAIREVGGSGNEATNSINGFTNQLQQFSITGESGLIPYLRALNLNIQDFYDQSGKVKPATDWLLTLSDRVQGMDKPRASFILRQMGLDDYTISILLKGRAATEDLIKHARELGIVTDQDAESGKALTAAWQGLNISSERLGRTMLTFLGPALGYVLDKLTKFGEWLQQNPDIMGPFAAAIAVAAGVITVAIGIATASFLGITAPIAAAVALILSLGLAVGLMYNDWKTWTHGGKSLFGDMYDYIAKGWKDVVTVFSDGWQIIRDLGSGNTAALKGDFAKFFGDLGDLAKNTVGAVVADVQAQAKIVSKIVSVPAAGISDFISSIFADTTGKGGVSSGSASGLADTITKGEGGYNSVNLGQRGGNRSGTRDLANMTVGQVMAAQNRGEFNAAGRYQIIRTTMALAFRALHLDPNAKFNAATQDKIFKDFLLSKKQPAIGDYISGKSNDLHAALKAAAAEWASIADPDTGGSAYAGQHASTSATQMAAALRAARAAAHQNLPSTVGARGAAAASTTHNHKTTSTSTQEIKTGDIIVTIPPGADAKATGKILNDALQNYTFGAMAPNGPA